MNDLRKRLLQLDDASGLDEATALAKDFLVSAARDRVVVVRSSTSPKYYFYRYEPPIVQKTTIARPIKDNLFISEPNAYAQSIDHLLAVLTAIRGGNRSLKDLSTAGYNTSCIDKSIYTTQQCLGTIADSFGSPNQARKKVGDTFERLVSWLLNQAGIGCVGRTVKIPIPGYFCPRRYMKYQLDLVLSQQHDARTTRELHGGEIVGSVKTTSKDRLDKIFMDKLMLERLLKREVPVFAIFLHDVQRAKRRGSPYGVAGTFKVNHFRGYMSALLPLDGVYYIDPPDVESDVHLHTFSRFIAQDAWIFFDNGRSMG